MYTKSAFPELLIYYHKLFMIINKLIYYLNYYQKFIIRKYHIFMYQKCFAITFTSIIQLPISHMGGDRPETKIAADMSQLWFCPRLTFSIKNACAVVSKISLPCLAAVHKVKERKFV